MAGRLAAFEVAAAGDAAGNFATSIPHLLLHTAGPHGAMCEADTMRSASLLAAEPGPAGHLEPLPASVPRYAESSDPIETARSPEEVNALLFLLSVCEGGQGEGTAMAVSELSTQDLGDAPRWQYPREINGEPSGYPQTPQQSGESVMRRGRSRCCPVGTHPGHTA